MLEKVQRRERGRYGFDRLLRATTLIFGPPKVGKTTFVATLGERVLLVETEPGGADYVEGVDVVEVHSLGDLKVLWKELSGLKEWRWEVVAIDTITQVSSWIEREVALEFGKPMLGGPSTAFGAEYAKHRAELVALIKSFQILPCGLILVAHSKGEGGEKITLNLPGRTTQTEVMALASNVIYLGVDESGRREAVVAPSPVLEAGSRDRVLNALGRFPPDFRELERLYNEQARLMGLLEEEKAEGQVGEEADEEGKEKRVRARVKLDFGGGE
ncbi:MAG: AAA family ATPase [Thermofilaceae archaeon]